MATKIPEAEYFDAVDNYLGWCRRCQEFTTDCVEPDAHGYECAECGQNFVVGAEDALICGYISIEGDAI